MNSAVMSTDFVAPSASDIAELSISDRAALNRVKQWRIHIGAHKTATTHLQQTLMAIRPRLVARGVDSIPFNSVRASGLAHALNRRRLLTRVPLLRGFIARRLVAEILEPMRHGPDTLVVSEEKFLGTPRRVFSEPFYPMVEHIVPTLASLGEKADVTLFLSIRSFDTHLPSTYAQELRVLPPPEGGFEAIRRRVLAKPPSWFELVRRIRKAAPDTPLRVWRQEDYRDNKEAILSAFVGCDTGPLPDLDDPTRTKSPSLEAIREAESLPRDLPAAERRKLVDEIFASAGPGTRFRPFSQDECRVFQDAYEKEMTRIEEFNSDILMRF